MPACINGAILPTSQILLGVEWKTMKQSAKECLSIYQHQVFYVLSNNLWDVAEPAHQTTGEEIKAVGLKVWPVVLQPWRPVGSSQPHNEDAPANSIVADIFQIPESRKVCNDKTGGGETPATVSVGKERLFLKSYNNRQPTGPGPAALVNAAFSYHSTSLPWEVLGLLCTAAAELSRCDRDHVTRKVESLHYLPLTKNIKELGPSVLMIWLLAGCGSRYQAAASITASTAM